VTIAVTGATGFIGRHVVAELQRRALDPVLVSRRAVAGQAAAGRVVTFDLNAAPDNVFEAMGRPRTLIHLAWGGLPNYRSLHHFESELPLQYRFIKAAVEGGVENVIVTGTCLEYGLQSGALHEGVLPQPTTAYGFAKDALRRQLEFLQQTRPFNLTWARLFYMYGEGQAQTSLLSQLRSAVERGDPSFDMSQGEQLRDYLPVTEVVDNLVALALAGRQHGIVNICSGKPVSVRRQVESWIAAQGWSIALNLGRYPYPDYEPLAFWGVNAKLQSCLSQPS
jgi:dTDP-6-deoxy-L-talose 4-dehydrogenase (NAD+)